MKSIFPEICVLGLILITLEVIGCSAEVVPQYAMLYRENVYGCYGRNYEWTFDTKTYPEPTWNMISFTARGIWYLEAPLTKRLFVSGSVPSCLVGVSTLNGTVTVTRILNTDMDDSAIALIPDHANVNLTAIRVVTAESQRFDQPSTFTGIVSTGIKDYSLFSGTDFNGASACLRVYHSDALVGYAASSSLLQEPLTVGSVRLGCRGDETVILNME